MIVYLFTFVWKECSEVCSACVVTVHVRFSITAFLYSNAIFFVIYIYLTFFHVVGSFSGTQFNCYLLIYHCLWKLLLAEFIKNLNQNLQCVMYYSNIHTNSSSFKEEVLIGFFLWCYWWGWATNIRSKSHCSCSIWCGISG